VSVLHAPTLLDAPSRRLSHAPPGSVTLPTEASLPWGRQAERIGHLGSALPGSTTRHGHSEIRECTLSVAGLVLAAGGGRRFGGPKALVRHEGSLLVERAVATARAGGCAPIVVVLGAGAAEVRAQAQLGDVMIVENEGWKAGMGSSLRAGLDALAATEADAAVVLLVDTPGVTADAVRRVAEKSGRDVLAAATYGNRRGHPVLLGRDHWAGVALLATADIGARAYLSARANEVHAVPCDDISDDTDIDFPEQS
jgi:nicotine blue oxidoreductase